MTATVTLTHLLISSDNAIVAEAAATGGVQTRIDSFRSLFKKKSSDGKYYFTYDNKPHSGTSAQSVDRVLKSNVNLKVLNKIVPHYGGAQCWGYFMSPYASDFNGLVPTNTKMQKTKGTLYYERFSLSANFESVRTGTFKRYMGKPLTPGTRYYYIMVCQIGKKWYAQSKLLSFTTTSIYPSKTTLKLAKDSDNIGLGDQATLLWDAANLADSYNISVKGPVSFSKNGIKASLSII